MRNLTWSGYVYICVWRLKYTRWHGDSLDWLITVFSLQIHRNTYAASCCYYHPYYMRNLNPYNILYKTTVLSLKNPVNMSTYWIYSRGFMQTFFFFRQTFFSFCKLYFVFTTARVISVSR